MYSWKTVLVTIGLLFGLKIWNPYLIENITWSWFDFLHQQHEIEQVEEIVLVDIDEKSLEKYGQYPYWRDIYADIMLGIIILTVMYSLNYSKNLIDSVRR